MASLAPTAPRAIAWPTLSPAMLAALGLTLAAFVIRAPHFGDPAYQVDEQFYLLVGDRMLHGALPYVDIWDRKPIGLFLIYAGVRLLGGEGIWQYQIVATVFAAATGWVISRIARRPAGELGGMAAGLLYLLWIETVEGGGGQSPVFYNLLVSGAAACTLAAGDTEDGKRFRRWAFVAMALAGLAIQVKYTALFEGAYFGAVLAWWTLRRAPDPRAALTRATALVATALAPTLAAIAFYVAIGQIKAFWFANFVSIFLRTPANPAELHHRLGQIALHILALAVCYTAGLWQLRRADAETRRWQCVVSGWMAAALAGFFSVGALYFHYMLPLFVPFSVGAAPIFRRRPLGPVMVGIALWLPASNLDYPDRATTRYWQARTAALQALIPADVRTGCMQMFAGPPILYHLTGACTRTRYVFPDHLVSSVETHAIGVDTQAEVRRLLATRPRVIVSDDGQEHLDPGSYGVWRAMRSRAYRRVGSVMAEGRRIDVWVANGAGA